MGGQSFLGGVRGIADQFARAEQVASGVEGKGRFAELRARGVYGQSNVDPIVYEKLGLISLAEPAGFFGELEEFLAAQILLTQLDGSDTAFESLLQDPEKIAAGGLVSIGDEIKIELGSTHWIRLTQNAFERA